MKEDRFKCIYKGSFGNDGIYVTFPVEITDVN